MVKIHNFTYLAAETPDNWEYSLEISTKDMK